MTSESKPNGESDLIEASGESATSDDIPSGAIYEQERVLTPAGEIALSTITHVWGTEGWPWQEAGHLYLTSEAGPVQVSLTSGPPADIEAEGLTPEQLDDLRRSGYDGPGPTYHLWPSLGVTALEGSDTHPIAHVRLIRSDEDGAFPVMVGGFRFHAGRRDSVSLPPSFQALDHPPPGSWRYAFGARSRPGSRVWCQRVQLQAFELPKR